MAQVRRKARLVVAVTGHRDIGPRDRQLAALVRSECARLRKQFARRRWTIVSPLAEGADRLLARIAMDVLDARLIVPLPLPLADPDGYLKDFPQSVRQFERLLARADAVFAGPLRSRDGKWREYGAARNRQYAWVGAYVAEHADVLFAIWDGKPARGIGGTAQVVRWFLDAAVPAAHSTLRLGHHDGPLPPRAPKLLVHINPATREVVRIPVR
jgi:hypothetical protein